MKMIFYYDLVFELLFYQWASHSVSYITTMENEFLCSRKEKEKTKNIGQKK